MNALKKLKVYKTYVKNKDYSEFKSDFKDDKKYTLKKFLHDVNYDLSPSELIYIISHTDDNDLAYKCFKRLNGYDEKTGIIYLFQGGKTQANVFEYIYKRSDIDYYIDANDLLIALKYGNGIISKIVNTIKPDFSRIHEFIDLVINHYKDDYMWLYEALKSFDFKIDDLSIKKLNDIFLKLPTKEPFNYSYNEFINPYYRKEDYLKFDYLKLLPKLRRGEYINYLNEQIYNTKDKYVIGLYLLLFPNSISILNHIDCISEYIKGSGASLSDDFIANASPIILLLNCYLGDNTLMNISTYHVNIESIINKVDKDVLSRYFSYIIKEFIKRENDDDYKYVSAISFVDRLEAIYRKVNGNVSEEEVDKYINLLIDKEKKDNTNNWLDVIKYIKITNKKTNDKLINFIIGEGNEANYGRINKYKAALANIKYLDDENIIKIFNHLVNTNVAIRFMNNISSFTNVYILDDIICKSNNEKLLKEYARFKLNKYSDDYEFDIEGFLNSLNR